MIRNSNQIPTLRIITLDSPGLLNDATIYKNIFKLHNYNVFILKIKYEDINNVSTEISYCDINLFLETISYTRKHNQPLCKQGNKIKQCSSESSESRWDIHKIFPSKINLFMPNYEFFLDYDKLKYIDFVLCKTKITMDMFTYLKKEHSYEYECVYTKFTTFIPKELRITNEKINKNVNLFVHLAGKSPFKNTNILVYTWIKYNGFMDIDPNIKLVITCYKSCYKRLLENLKKYQNYKVNWDKNTDRDDMLIHKNMTFYFLPAPNDEYLNLLYSANVAICSTLSFAVLRTANDNRRSILCMFFIFSQSEK
jgi:hypothetical protein